MPTYTLEGEWSVRRHGRVTVVAADLAAAKLSALAAVKVPTPAVPVRTLSETYINGSAVLTGHVREVVDAV